MDATITPTGPLRRLLAQSIAAAYGYGLFAIWIAPFGVLHAKLLDEAPRAAWMALGVFLFSGLAFLVLPRRWYELAGFERDGKLYRRLGVRRIRYFVGLGDGISRVARAVDPNWQHPWSSKSYEEWKGWTALAECIHLGFLVCSLVPILLAIQFGFRAFAVVLLLANIPFNVYPIMLQRYTRAKLGRIIAREAKHGREGSF